MRLPASSRPVALLTVVAVAFGMVASVSISANPLPGAVAARWSVVDRPGRQLRPRCPDSDAGVRYALRPVWCRCGFLRHNVRRCSRSPAGGSAHVARERTAASMRCASSRRRRIEFAAAADARLAAAPRAMRIAVVLMHLPGSTKETVTKRQTARAVLRPTLPDGEHCRFGARRVQRGPRRAPPRGCAQGARSPAGSRRHRVARCRSRARCSATTTLPCRPTTATCPTG